METLCCLCKKTIQIGFIHTNGQICSSCKNLAIEETAALLRYEEKDINNKCRQFIIKYRKFLKQIEDSKLEDVKKN